MAQPTAQDILMWALINRARLDPAGEAARDGIDLNEGLPAGTISTASKQPLAWNGSLFSAADQHSLDMLSRQYFAHTDPVTGSTPQSRANAAGYSGSVGENIVWSGSKAAIDATQMIYDEEKVLFVDANITGRGHRLNILNDQYQEVGVGQELGTFQGFNASMITQDYGLPSAGGQFLTGIAYNDTNGDGFYSVGEGRGGISVATSGGTALTDTPGEYSQTISAGNQTITFSGGDLASPVTITATITAGRNALIDLVGQSIVETSVSLTAGNGVRKIIGLGNLGLTLTGNNTSDTFVSPTGGTNTLNGGNGFDIAVFSGPKANYTITPHANGTETVAGLGLSDTLNSIEKLQFSDQSVLLHEPAHDDFNGDDSSDILFRNDANGDTWYAGMSNGTLAGWHPIGGSGTSYAAVGVGDFYGTGTSDALFRNNTTGDTWFEAISNGAFAGWSQIGGSDTHYSVVGVADCYGNGTDDVLFRNSSTGDTWFAAMSNGGFAGWHQIGGSNTTYQVVGVGDFYGNGADDILFCNNSTGDTWIEAMSNGSFNGWQQIGGSDTHYSVVGVGDFFGNGTDDILFRNNSTGETWFEAISNGAFNGWHQVGGSDTNYAVVGIGDYFGSGTSNILFRNNSTGDTWFEVMSNGSFAGWNHIGGSNTSYAVKT